MKCQLVNENFQENYIDSLLRARGVIDLDTIKHPSVSSLLDPKLLSSIEEGARLYVDKVNNGTHIVLIVDSDNDGFTSAAIIHQYTLKLNPNIKITTLLHDHKEHGLEDHCDEILNMNEKIDLIILPDSSSNDYEYHEALKDIAPCLVLDHHEADPPFSTNAIIINNQLSPNYSNKQLTGAGVVWQFCRYLDKMLNLNYSEDFIDLAAWGVN